MSKVLVVDDDASIRRMLRAMVEQVGDEPICASTGEEGYALALEERPEIAIVDNFMPPGISGIELCGRFRTDSRVSRTYVILTTGKWDRDTMFRAFRARIDDFFLRPFRYDELRGRLENARAVIARELAETA